MAFNGSGTFNLYTPGNPVVTGTTISSTWANNTLSDIATGLSNCITKDGQTTPTANIPMGSNRLTGLAAATSRTDAIQYAQVQDGSPTYLTSPSGTNTVTATAPNTMAAYAAGQVFRFIPANTNTGATTLNINSIGAKNVYWKNAACIGGELVQNVPVEVIYDGTQFQIIGPIFTGMTLLGSSTASGASAITFTGLTGYGAYLFVMDNIYPSTDGDNFWMRFSNDNGSTYNSGAAAYVWAHYIATAAATSGNAGSTADTKIVIDNQAISNDGNNGHHGNLWMYAVTSKNTYITQNATSYNNTGGTTAILSSGRSTNTTTVNAVQFKMSSGNINGTIYCYGIRSA